MDSDTAFDGAWAAAVRFRRVSRELAPLVRGVYDQVLQKPADLSALKSSLVAMLEFLASEDGRTDANCCAIDAFFGGDWMGDLSRFPEPYRALLDDLHGVVHDAIYAPKIAATFRCLPEQLLERARNLLPSNG